MQPPSHRRKATFAVGLVALILFAAAFVVAWAASFWVLWDFLYGDRHGGRWVHLAWAPALLAGCIAAGLFWIRVVLGHRLRSRVYWACLLGWVVFFAVSVPIGGKYLGAPLFWKPPPAQPRQS